MIMKINKNYNESNTAANPPVKIEKKYEGEGGCWHDKKYWGTSTMYKAAQELEPYDLQLAALNLDVQFPLADTIANFCYQYKRVMDADLSYPIIQAPDGWIMDGYHRIAKAILEGRTTIKCVRLKVLPEVDRIE